MLHNVAMHTHAYTPTVSQLPQSLTQFAHQEGSITTNQFQEERHLPLLAESNILPTNQPQDTRMVSPLALCDGPSQLDVGPIASGSTEGPSTVQNPETELEKLLGVLKRDQDMEHASTQLVRAPSLLYPTGPLMKKFHKYIYSKLFHLAWSGQDQQAMSIVTALRRSNHVSLDLKVVSMEVAHTVNNDRDLKMLGSALAYTDRTECENKPILKCRLHRRIAGLHYRNGDVDEARDHLETALQLASQIGPDIDTAYTFRLQALMLFDEYKKTGNEQTRRDSEKFFRQAMDHARCQPQ